MRSWQFLTIHPEFIRAYFSFGVFKSAERLGHSLSAVSLRSYAVDKHSSIDASPFGGGDGMVMRIEPLVAALADRPRPSRVIFASPSGRMWTHADALRLAQMDEDVSFVCGRFAGVDQRFIDTYVAEEISLGDFVVSGGELPSLMIADSILRLIPGVLGNASSAACDSFAEGCGGILEYPTYTRPLEFEGMKVPEVLLSGDHRLIAEWRQKEALARTRERRPDLLKDRKE